MTPSLLPDRDLNNMVREKDYDAYHPELRRSYTPLNNNFSIRIGIIAHLKHAICEPFAGGLEMHTHLLARTLQCRGHEVTIFASTRSEPSHGLEAICDATGMQEVDCDDTSDITFFKEHHAYLTLMNSLRRREFDIIHNNSLHYLPVVMADALPMPVVTTLHTPPFCWLESGVRICGARNSTFVAVSESIRRSWSPITAIDRVVLNGIDLDRFAFCPDPDPTPYLVWFGRIVPEKGLDMAIQVAESIGAELRIAGPALDQEYYAAQVAPRLTESIRHVGHLDHLALSRLIAGARAFLCTPRWDEPYGLVVAEALACGVPVAAFARGAIPEILDASCGVLAAPDDVPSLAAAAIAAQRLDRRDCRRRAVAACNVTTMIEGYEQLYGLLLSRREEADPRGARSIIDESGGAGHIPLTMRTTRLDSESDLRVVA